ncbi:MAG: MFS transporter [Lentisphaerae bacterium]|nr:MFS transporter [Lentisphaerota bacterium]
MIKLLSYLFPILVNFVCGGVFFITALRCSQASAPGWVVGATLSTWSLVYSVVSFIAGKVTTVKNSVMLISAGGLMITAASAGFLLFPGVYSQFIWIALTGVAAATYCTSFQVFAKSIEQNQNTGVVRATALYTASWSLGMATGPFVFGLLPVNLSFVINAALGLVIAGGIVAVSKTVKRRENTADEQGSCLPETGGMPDCVWVGWIIGGVGTIAIFVIRCLVPYRAHLLEFSRAEAGIILAVVSFVQAFTALALINVKTMMYKALPVVLAGLCGISSLLIFGFGSGKIFFAIAAVLFGIYSGYFYFMFVYHSLISPVNSTRYVAINEIIVGIMGTVGPFAGGLLTTPSTSGTAFPVMAVLCGLSIIFAVFYFCKNKK